MHRVEKWDGARPRFDADVFADFGGVQCLVIQSYGNANRNIYAAIELLYITVQPALALVYQPLSNTMPS